MVRAARRKAVLARRRLLVALAALIGAKTAATFGQTRDQPSKLGWLSTISASDRDAAFLHALRDLGYTEGKTILIERRYLQGQSDRLAAVAAELVERKVDVISANNRRRRC